jgi:hypothetical protein
VKTGDHVFGSAFGTTTRYCSSSSPSARLQFIFLYVIGAALLERENTGTASFLHCIERDGYTDKCYVD